MKLPLPAACALLALWPVLFACQPAPVPGTNEQQELVLEDSLPVRKKFDPMDEVIGLHEQWTGDLDGMIKRRRIRALVPYSQSVYYIDGPERRGIAYESMVYFEEEINRNLGNKMKGKHTRIIFIPMTRDQLLPALLAGYGDIIPANLMVTDSRKDLVEFSTPTFTNAREVAVSSSSLAPMESLHDLSGKTVHIRKSSSFHEHILALNDSLKSAGKVSILVEFVEEHFEDEELLEMVNAGIIPMTVVDESLAMIWGDILDSIRVHSGVAIHSGGQLAWAMRKDSPLLKESVDAFIQKNRKGTHLGNIIFNRYLKNVKFVSNALTREELERFRACRDYFIAYGEQYQFDWLILAAQGYQESRLDQKARSPAGAVGVMQIKPSTARDPNVNVPNVEQMEDNIHAGTKYLRFLIDRYFTHPEIDSLNAGLLAMAAYNAGPARVLQLRKKTEAAGLDPNIWFDNVEILAAREIGRETVQYVSNIYKYYASYRGLYRYMQETGKVPYEGW